MQNGILEAELRLPVVRLAITMIRSATKIYFRSDRYGATADELIICLAIFIGQAEGRPMNAGKLAQYAGVPRPSAIRKLASLEKRGIVSHVDGAYLIPESVINSEVAMTLARRVRRRLIEKATKVSKMDSLAVARNDPPTVVIPHDDSR